MADHNNSNLLTDDSSEKKWSSKSRWLLAGASMVAIATATTGTAHAVCTPAPANGVTTTCDETDLNTPLAFDDLNVTFSHTTPGSVMIGGPGIAISLTGNGAQSVTITDDLAAVFAGASGIQATSLSDTANAGGVTIDTSAGSVIANSFGIYAATGAAATGAITIITEDVVSATLFGIGASAGAASTGLSIDTTAGDIGGSTFGILAINAGTGDTTITTGPVASSTGTGIQSVTGATAGSTTIDSSAGGVSGNVYGINVIHGGTGNTTLITADVSSTTNDGIQVNHSANSGDLSIDTSAGTVQAFGQGIDVYTYAGSATIVTADVVSFTSNAIASYAGPATTDVSIDTSAGSVTATVNGINSVHIGTGSASITTADVTASVDGIVSYTGVGTTSVTIDTSAGALSGNDDGIIALHYGTGDATITTADISASGDDGIYLYNSAAGGNISIDSSAGAITANGDGIYSVQLSTTGGTSTIVTGDVTAITANAIFAYAAPNSGDVSIDSSAGSLLGTNGVFAYNSGSGSTTITTADITGTAGSGIASYSGPNTTGVTIDSSAGSVSGTSYGIYAVNLGVGDTTVITGNVSASTRHGVYAVNGATAGDITIDTSAGAVTATAPGFTAGILAINSSPTGNVTVTTGDVTSVYGIATGSYGTNTVTVTGTVVGSAAGVYSISGTGSNITITASGSIIAPTAITTDSTPLPGGLVNDTITNAGSISGSVSTLAGDDTFTSTGTVVAGSVVDLGTENDTANIGGIFDGTLDLNTGDDTLNLTDLSGLSGGTFDGNAGIDDLNVVGATGDLDASLFANFENLAIDNSNVTLITNGTFLQTNIINSGTLDLGGQTLTSPLFVDASSTLAGSGNLVGNALVDGRIDLAATDLIDITGNLALNGVLDTDYNAGAVGSVNVTGSVNTGVTQTVNLTVIDPTGLSHGTVIPVIVSTGGVTHNGAGLATDNMVGLDFLVGTAGNNLVLTAAANFNGTPSGDDNIDNAAGAVQSLATTPGAFAANPFLFTLATSPTLADMQQGIDELSPADGGSIPSVIKASTHMLADAVPTACFDNRVNSNQHNCSDIKRGRIWGSIGYGTEKADRQILANNDLNNAEHTASQVAVGGMFAVRPNTTIGGGIAYQNVDFDETGTTTMTGSGNGFGVFGHVNYQLSQAELFGAVGHSQLSLDHTRAIPFLAAQAEASHDASATFIKAGVRGAITLSPHSRLVPEASITHIMGTVDGYDEAGTPAGLRVEEFDVESTLGSFGGRLETRITNGFKPSTKANGYLGYTYTTDFNNDDQLLRASFLAGGNGFDTLLAGEEDASHRIAAGLHGYMGNGLEYQLEVGHRFNDAADETKLSVRVGKGW